MYRSCSKCGKVHDSNYHCTYNKPTYKPEYKSKEDNLRNTYSWHKKAEEIKEASSYLCAVCKDKRIYNYNDLEVHHITKLREDTSRLLDNYNLICLCRNCHKLADKGMIDKDYLINLARLREEKG